MASNFKGKNMNVRTNAIEEDSAKADPVVTTETTEVVTDESTVVATVETPVVAPEPVSGVVVTSTSAPAGKEAPAAFKQALAKESTVAESKVSGFAKKIADVMEKGSAREKGVVNFMTKYLSEMMPGKPIDGKAGAAQQGQFIRTFTNVAQHPDNFKECMDLFVAYFREYKDTAFHEHYAFRFTDSMTQSPETIYSFTAVVNLLKIASTTPNKKDVSKHVDLSRSLNSTFSEEARQRIIGYFN